MKNLLFILLLLTTTYCSLNAQLLDRDYIALKSDNGNWLARCQNCQNASTPNTATVHMEGEASNLLQEAKFKVEKLSSGKVNLKADNGKYLSRCNGCVTNGPKDILTVHSENWREPSAQFEVEKLPNGRYVFKSDNGKYLARCKDCSPGSSVPDIVAIHETDKNARWAQWEVKVLNLIPNGSTIALKSDSGNWLARCQTCQNASTPNTATVHMKGDASSLPQYAKFKVETLSNGKIALSADNGKFLAWCNNCVTGGPTDILAVHKDNNYETAAQFEPERLANGKYVFKSDNGKYLARCNGCSPGSTVPDIVAIHESNKNSLWAQWEVIFY